MILKLIFGKRCNIIVVVGALSNGNNHKVRDVQPIARMGSLALGFKVNNE